MVGVQQLARAMDDEAGWRGGRRPWPQSCYGRRTAVVDEATAAAVVVILCVLHLEKQERSSLVRSSTMAIVWRPLLREKTIQKFVGELAKGFFWRKPPFVFLSDSHRFILATGHTKKAYIFYSS
mgnify:CR=1 FL=1